jgi:hypothetical protein
MGLISIYITHSLQSQPLSRNRAMNLAKVHSSLLGYLLFLRSYNLLPYQGYKR